MASPARARRRSISRPWPRPCARGGQVLILLPEIALTGAFPRPLRQRVLAASRREWHSDVAPRDRERLWRGVADRGGARRGRRALGAVPAVHRPSASSSSTRSMTAPTSRRTASPITPATWRWCAAASAPFRWCCPRRRRRSRSRVNADQGRYRRIVLPDRFAGAELPRDAGRRSARRPARARALAVAAAACRRSPRRWRQGSRRCSSSTAAATRR